jgi:hypothetical protein
MKYQILKIIFFAFIISLAISFLFSWTNYISTSGNEAKQGMFIFVLLNVFLCLINFVLALPGLLNMNEKIRKNIIFSSITFFSLPLAFYIFLSILYFQNQNSTENLIDFLNMSIPSITFCITLVVKFYDFRKKPENQVE